MAFYCCSVVPCKSRLFGANYPVWWRGDWIRHVILRFHTGLNSSGKAEAALPVGHLESSLRRTDLDLCMDQAAKARNIPEPGINFAGELFVRTRPASRCPRSLMQAILPEHHIGNRKITYPSLPTRLRAAFQPAYNFTILLRPSHRCRKAASAPPLQRYNRLRS